MKTKIIIGAIAVMLLVVLAGCKAPTCYPPNKILGNKCCLDENDNNVCDYEEDIVEEIEPLPEPEPEVEYAPEPEIQEVDVPEPEPLPPKGLVVGVQDMRLGEQRDWLTINKMSAYRTSRDKGLMDYMTFTVRNLGQKKLNPVVEIFFEGARVGDYESSVKKEYVLQELEPGEKIVVNQSLGIRFADMEEDKDLTFHVFDRFIAPRENLVTLKKTIVPTDLMDSLEIYTYGKPE